MRPATPLFPRAVFRPVSVVLVLFLLLLGVTAAGAAALTVRVSVSTGGIQGNGTSNASDTSLSESRRYVAFQSAASNLVGNDTNAVEDIFVRDQETGAIARASVSAAGEQGNGASTAPSISNNGRFVAFVSAASNLVPNDTNGATDIFVRDLQQGTTTRISVTFQGEQVNAPSDAPAISGNGRYVAFHSVASNLVTGDTNGALDAFVRDLQGPASAITRVSVSFQGEQAIGRSGLPAISGDGRYVAFGSDAGNLVPGDANEVDDIFVRDMQGPASAITRVSLTSQGQEGDGGSFDVSLSDNGRFVAFESAARNLVPGDTNAANDVFVRDLQSGVGSLRRASVTYRGEQADGGSFDPELSDNGRFLAWVSDATNLVVGDTNGVLDIFSRDLRSSRADTISRISVSYRGEQGEGQSRIPTISGDGRYVAFGSDAANLVVNDTNAVRDVFMRRNDAGSPPGRIVLSIRPKQGQRKLNLGGVKVGRSKTRNFTVKNSGGRQLVVRIVTPEAPFGVVVRGDNDLSFTLAPHKSQKVNVTFHPTETGRATQTLTFQSNDPRQPAVEVQLIGAGR